MRTLTSGLAAALVACLGCAQSEPGGQPNTGVSFRLHAPALPTVIKQGDTESVTVSVVRGTAFKENVELQADAPQGLDVDVRPKQVKVSEPGDVRLKITVNDKAPLGDHTIIVTGTPERGKATSVEIKVNVKE